MIGESFTLWEIGVAALVLVVTAAVVVLGIRLFHVLIGTDDGDA